MRAACGVAVLLELSPCCLSAAVLLQFTVLLGR